MKPLCLVTGNKHKVEEFGMIVGDRFAWVHQKLDVPELQGHPEEVAREKCRCAAELYGGPVITEDVSLCVSCLGGMPGVYVKYFLESVGPEGIWRMLQGFEDKAAYTQCIYSFSEGPGSEPRLFVGRRHGTMTAPKGISQFGAQSFDAIFAPDCAGGLTYAEMAHDEKNKISHRAEAAKLLQEFLLG